MLKYLASSARALKVCEDGFDEAIAHAATVGESPGSLVAMLDSLQVARFRLERLIREPLQPSKEEEATMRQRASAWSALFGVEKSASALEAAIADLATMAKGNLTDKERRGVAAMQFVADA